MRLVPECPKVAARGRAAHETRLSHILGSSPRYLSDLKEEHFRFESLCQSPQFQMASCLLQLPFG